ncbi:hypothetical protein K1T71_012719 [Dendrolimus kikuchii]|uniref:Uncharacterized protein n=1 Tax=Dendrolimus kikuchii TaxID=765133 RepID=A0ACC1CK66_9NEOP|nr:hypothetical protein K1T71_012719 [Dendrolimus kikuchii]
MSIKGFKGTKVVPKSVFAELPQTYPLSKEQLRFYDANGYLVLKELIDFASLYAFKHRFAQICNGLTKDYYAQIIKDSVLMAKTQKPEEYVNKLQDILYDDVFSQYSENPRLLHVVSQLLGDDITGMHSMFINKPPGTDRHPPHQDMYYFPFRPADKIVGTWTAVDHVSLDNGCLYVVPGSHKANILYPHVNQLISIVLYHGILDEETVAPEERRVHLEMSPGDTVFLHPMLVHGSGPNITTNYRKAISVHYAASSCEYVDVSGTVQEMAAKEVEEIARKKGFNNIKFQDVWKLKSKQVKGVRSNL